MKIWHYIIFIIASFLFGLFFILIPNPLEYFILDIKTVLASSFSYREYDISKHVIIILIDKRSEDELFIPIEGKDWREYDPEVINILLENGVNTIAFDVEFSGKETEWDDNLLSAYKKAGNVITCEIEEGATSDHLLNGLLAVGDSTLLKISGTPRKFLAFPKGSKLKAFSLLVAQNFLEKNPKNAQKNQKKALINSLKNQPKIQPKNPENPPINNQHILLKNELSSNKEYWINYKYPVHYFPVFSYIDIYNSENGRIADEFKTPLSIIKDKVVLVAKDFIKDRAPLPNSFGKSIYGGLAHSYAIETLLDRSWLRKAFIFWEIVLLLVTLIILQFLTKALNRGISFIIFFIFLIVLLVFQVFIYQKNHIWMNFSSLLTASLLLAVINDLYRRSITLKELKKIEIQVKILENLNMNLEESGKWKDILTDTLVHDIKNATSAIEGSLVFVTDKYKSDRQSLQIFHAASIACTDIINLSSNLLDVRKIEEGKLNIQFTECSFHTVKELIERFAHYPLFYEKSIELIIEPALFNFRIIADMYLLEQIFHNLLSNALKHTRKNGKIQIITSEKDGNIFLTFYNSGKPVPDEHKEKIFGKYNTVGKKRSRYSKGLGLFFCRKAMEIQKGRIWLETDESGNYFKLSFPKVQSK